jgi:hypothetical protein
MKTIAALDKTTCSGKEPMSTKLNGLFSETLNLKITRSNRRLLQLQIVSISL